MDSIIQYKERVYPNGCESRIHHFAANKKHTSVKKKLPQSKWLKKILQANRPKKQAVVTKFNVKMIREDTSNLSKEKSTKMMSQF